MKRLAVTIVVVVMMILAFVGSAFAIGRPVIPTSPSVDVANTVLHV